MPQPEPIPPAAVRRVLVTRLKFLGDVVLTTPVLRALRQALPHASIEYLTLEPYAPALRHHPDLDRVHALPAAAGVLQTLQMARALARPQVDWWIDLMGSPRSALLAALARPRVAIGPDRGVRRRVYHHRRGRPTGDRSAVRHHLDKLAPLLGPLEPSAVRIVADPALRASARRRLGLPSVRPLLLIHPGSTWPATAWPERRFAELLMRLHGELPHLPCVVATADDPGRAARVVAAAAVPARALPALPLSELLALVAEASLYVGNDGGVLHCAVALGVPTVGVFGPTEPDIWFPHAGLGPHRVVLQEVPCRPCHLHSCDHLTCLRTLPASTVQAEVHEVLRMAAAAERAHA